MLPKISRYFLIIIAIIVLANILPRIYNTLFDVRIHTPYITYSTLMDDFYIMKRGDEQNTFIDTKGLEYTQEEFMANTPVVNAFYHVSNGTLPDSVNGVRLNIQQLRNEYFFQRMAPRDFSAPNYDLYPLLESQPKFGLTFPKDFFRINDRIEFIDAQSNTINEEKSREFTDALQKADFVFPAKIVAGMPTLMKSRDDGWFLTDSKGALYHLKMIKSEPYVKHISTPEGFKVKEIFCNDFRSREFLALIVTENNNLFIIDYRDYSLTEFPISDYNPAKETLSIRGNMFHRTVTLAGNNYIKAYALNRSYDKVNEYEEQWLSKSEMIGGKIADYIFPFTISFESSASRYITFLFKGFGGYHWIYLNALLLGITFLLIRIQRKRLSNNILDLAIVSGTGLFGFIAIYMFPNKEY